MCPMTNDTEWNPQLHTYILIRIYRTNTYVNTGDTKIRTRSNPERGEHK